LNDCMTIHQLFWAESGSQHRRSALSAALLAASNVALAIGLGTPSTAPVIGQPLRIEIPLMVATGETLPTNDCIRITPPGDAPDRQFFPRNARVLIEGGSRPKVRIIGAEAVTEPLIEFRLTLGCGNSFARDFLILSEAPAAAKTPIAPYPTGPAGAANSAQPSWPAITASETGAGVTASIQGPVSTNAVNGTTIRLTHDSTLNALARRRYPANQNTRDEYRRLMAQANPALFAGMNRVGSVALPAGTLLTVPPDLPPPESELQPQGDMASNPVLPTGNPKRNNQRPLDTSARQPLPRQDRLTIGGDAAGTLGRLHPLSPREMAAAMDRLERMLEDQGRTEHQMISNLETLNSAFIEVKNYVQTLQSQLQQMEKAQQAQQLKIDNRPEPKALGILELLSLILVSGGVGAGLILLHHRLKIQRTDIVANQPDADEQVSQSPPHIPAAVPPAPTFAPPPRETPSAISPKAALPDPPRPAVPTAKALDAAPKAAPVQDTPLEFHLPERDLPASVVPANSSEHGEAVELAEIMMSMGLGKEAARTLVDHILTDPKRDLAAWLKALEIYRRNGQREEFESLATSLQLHLNVKPAGWDGAAGGDTRTLVDFQHLAKHVVSLWPTSECADFLDHLLRDNRDGERQGFPQSVAEEIVLLQRILRDR
jgi:hypothetical protein